MTRRRLPLGESALNILYSKYLYDAVRRHREFTLSKEQFREITKKNCHYCGVEPGREFKTKDCNGSYICNGIDRVDSSKGYILDNVVPCCWICNRAKRELAESEFLAWVDKIYEHQHPTKG